MTNQPCDLEREVETNFWHPDVSAARPMTQLTTRTCETRGGRMAGAPEGKSVPQLVVTKPDRLQGRIYPITDEYAVVGRQEGCDLRLDDVAVSRIHAALQRARGGTVVSDLGSSNGTMVNGSPVGSMGHLLRPGDVLRIGNVEMRFRAGAERSSAEPSSLRL